MNQYESDVPKIPDYKLSEKQFLLQRSSGSEQARLVGEIMDAIKKDNLAPYYKHLAAQLPALFPLDESVYENLAAANEKQILELQKVVQQAESDEETEVDIVLSTTKLAEYYTQIIDRENAKETYTKVLLLTADTGAKIDVLLTLARIGFFFNDYREVATHLAEVDTLIEKGGDWERRNRHKTYKGIYHMATRNFAEAAGLLIDSLATFTSTELCSYEQLAQYAMIAGVISLDRVDLKAKIVDLPEILSIYSGAKELEPLVTMTKCLYTCQYNHFLRYLLETNDLLVVPNKYLHVHSSYFMREMRCKAYAQLLESYKLLSLTSMATSFNVSEEFLDADLARFIPNGKLNCTINMVNGIIETNRPDNKNSQFHLLIKQGDALLTKLQKYGAAVKLSGAERV